jgi:hypothetical protein
MRQLVYDSFLDVSGLVLNRLPPDSMENVWAKALKDVVMKKSTVKKKQILFSLIHKNNIILSEMIKTL